MEAPCPPQLDRQTKSFGWQPAFGLGQFMTLSIGQLITKESSNNYFFSENGDITNNNHFMVATFIEPGEARGG